jgi:hypothetical protein
MGWNHILKVPIALHLKHLLLQLLCTVILEILLLWHRHILRRTVGSKLKLLISKRLSLKLTAKLIEGLLAALFYSPLPLFAF